MFLYTECVLSALKKHKDLGVCLTGSGKAEFNRYWKLFSQQGQSFLRDSDGWV